jgi:hypothetical protein
MEQFTRGALTMASLVAALFFFRFRRDTGENLFGMFGAAFAVLALHWLLLGFLSVESEHVPFAYLLRLLAFLLILLGIWQKNRHTR